MAPTTSISNSMRGTLRILSDTFSPNHRTGQSLRADQECILNEDDIVGPEGIVIDGDENTHSPMDERDMPPVFEDPNMKLILNNRDINGKSGAEALWAIQSGCVCSENAEVGFVRGQKRYTRKWKLPGEGQEERKLGLFNCLSHPNTCIFSTCCPCLAELYVGWSVGKRLLAISLGFVTLLYFSLIILSAMLDAILLTQEKEQKLQVRHNSVMITSEERRLHNYVTWSYVTYFMFIGLFFVRLGLYVITRKRLRRLLFSPPMVTKEEWAMMESTVAGSDPNPELCNGAPDLCAVFWCMPCVLCQHLETVWVQQSIQSQGQLGQEEAIFRSPLRGGQAVYEQLKD